MGVVVSIHIAFAFHFWFCRFVAGDFMGFGV
jgi:hypothetical protein